MNLYDHVDRIRWGPGAVGVKVDVKFGVKVGATVGARLAGKGRMAP